MSAPASLNWVDRLPDTPAEIRDKVGCYEARCQQWESLRREIQAEHEGVLAEIRELYPQEEIQKAVSYSL